jgi:hypothetical protein
LGLLFVDKSPGQVGVVNVVAALAGVVIVVLAPAVVVIVGRDLRKVHREDVNMVQASCDDDDAEQVDVNVTKM